MSGQVVNGWFYLHTRETSQDCCVKIHLDANGKRYVTPRQLTNAAKRAARALGFKGAEARQCERGIVEAFRAGLAAEKISC